MFANKLDIVYAQMPGNESQKLVAIRVNEPGNFDWEFYSSDEALSSGTMMVGKQSQHSNDLAPFSGEIHCKIDFDDRFGNDERFSVYKTKSLKHDDNTRVFEHMFDQNSGSAKQLKPCLSFVIESDQKYFLKITMQESKKHYFSFVQAGSQFAKPQVSIYHQYVETKRNTDEDLNLLLKKRESERVEQDFSHKETAKKSETDDKICIVTSLDEPGDFVFVCDQIPLPNGEISDTDSDESANSPDSADNCDFKTLLIKEISKRNKNKLFT